MNTMENLVCVRHPGSHRRRDRAQGALGFKPQEYYGWHVNGHYWFLTEEDFAKVKPYGATRSRTKAEQLSRCWSSSNDPRFAVTQPYPTP
jgi:hypothetical protein